MVIYLNGLPATQAKPIVALWGGGGGVGGGVPSVVMWNMNRLWTEEPGRL